MDNHSDEEYYSESSSNSSYSYSDDSNSSKTSYETDEDELDDGSKWGTESSLQSVKNAFASNVSDTLADVDLSGRRHLRKQESRYGNKNVESILPMGNLGNNCRSMNDDFMLINDTHDKEKVGHYVNASGEEIAEVWESKPPPPNGDYRSHAPSTSNLKLTRLMGFDPNKEVKKSETKGIVNPPERLNGDADLSAERLAQTSEITSRNVFFNKRHTQGFSDYDSKRSSMYDGFNDSRDPAERVHALEPTQRNETGEFRDPSHAHLASGKQIHNVSAKRVEISEPWMRHPQKTPNGGFSIGSISSLPILTDTNRNNTTDKTPNAHLPHASFTQSPRTDKEDRIEKNTDMVTKESMPFQDTGSMVHQDVDMIESQRDVQINEVTKIGTVDIVSRKAIPQISDALDTDREQHLPKPKVMDTSAWASMVKQLDTERDASQDDSEISAYMKPVDIGNVGASGVTLQEVQITNEDVQVRPWEGTKTNNIEHSQISAKSSVTRSDVADKYDPRTGGVHLKSAVKEEINLSGTDVIQRTRDDLHNVQVQASLQRSDVDVLSDEREHTGRFEQGSAPVEQGGTYSKSTTYRQEASTNRTNLGVSQHSKSNPIPESNTTREGMELSIMSNGSVPHKGGFVDAGHDMSIGYRQQMAPVSTGHEDKGHTIHQSTDGLHTERDQAALEVKNGAIENGKRQNIFHNHISHGKEELIEENKPRGKQVSSFSSHQYLHEIDRIPILSSATFHMGVAGFATDGHEVRTTSTSRDDTNRTHVAERGPARAHAQVEPRNYAREVAPMRSQSGATLGPERMSNYRPSDKMKIDLQMRPDVSELPDRSTPIMRTYASPPIQPNRISHSVFDQTGRDTPNSRIFGRATNLP